MYPLGDSVTLGSTEENDAVISGIGGNRSEVSPFRCRSPKFPNGVFESRVEHHGIGQPLRVKIDVNVVSVKG
jgi:hypothetical protein